ncbi:MAG TPA: carboxylesterase/lipase family protein [Acidimicrobiales bacterium]|nr:carboxylesterase/lipase family protein [Acidimicrobiales bacterium]
MIASSTTGKIQGFDKDGVVQFRGIRYATAERFRAPRPVDPWDDVYDATTFGAPAPQNPSPLESMLSAPPVEGNEDCLFLNVYTPAVDDGARPVMVWIHGGAFTAGQGSTPWYSGSRLASQGDVVVVTINYRLGALGFLHLDSVLGAGFEGSGNNGIRDQIAAIQWVKDNIAAFGGDPGHITIFGESAGGMSVGTLLGTPGVPELLTGAIAQSGAADHAKSLDDAQQVTSIVLDELGVVSSGADALLALPVDALLAAQLSASTRLAEVTGLGLGFSPVVDGVVLPQPPIDAIRAGSAANVSLLAGTTAEEWNLFHLIDRASGPMDEIRLERRLAKSVGDRASDVIAAYRDEAPSASNDDLWCAIATDWVFRIPAVRLLEAQSPHQPSTYSYVFSYKSTAFDGALGACHAVEIPFAFDNVDRRGVNFFLGQVDDGTRALSTAVSRAWTAMARNGSPDHDGIPGWPPYSDASRAVMELGPTIRILDDPGSGPRRLWAELWSSTRGVRT